MKIAITALLILFSAGLVAAQTAPSAESPLNRYNVTWTSPSQDSSGSMPLGNGDVGINLWVEPSGDLVFYLSKTDAWSETARLLKLGRVRVRFSPNPFASGTRFRQTLNLAKGEIQIVGGQPETRLTVWVDANNPVVRIESEHGQDTNAQVYYERWRDQPRLLEGQEAHSAYGMHEGPEPIMSYGDSLQLDAEDRVVWYHYNPKSIYASTMKLQGLEDMAKAYRDPLLHRTFGAGMEGPGFTKMNTTSLRSRAAQRRHAFSVFALTAITDTPELWIAELNRTIARVNALKLEDRRAAHDRWWDTFWNRSYLRITGGAEQDAVTQGYVLQRFLDACAGRGEHPIKFNGSIFTWDAKDKDAVYDADYRRWGGPYWFQNTRLIYWPMLANGDYEMMLPFFNMYKELRLVAEDRTKRYFNHDGAFFPETMYFFGAYANTNYGWNRAGKPVSFVENTYIRHYFTGGLELLAMMLDYYEHTEDKRFLKDTVTPLAESILTFYDKHYERDPNGKLRMAPAQALETWQDVVNPAPDVAGLRHVIAALTAAKAPVSKQVQQAMRRLQTQLPELPMREINGKKVISPAERIFGERKNTENAELYPVFPFRLYGVNKPDLEIGRNTFENRTIKANGGWVQDSIQAALLGMANQARRMIVESFTAQPAGRFPAFWGPNYDWSPDQDHGHVAMLATQFMLMQTEGDKILLFPAWPKDWDVEFKLRAPQNTTVEGAWKGGKLERLTVTPAKRSADVIRMDPE
jgi:alpha-L-fucosidase 2